MDQELTRDEALAKLIPVLSRIGCDFFHGELQTTRETSERGCSLTGLECLCCGMKWHELEPERHTPECAAAQNSKAISELPWESITLMVELAKNP